MFNQSTAENKYSVTIQHYLHYTSITYIIKSNCPVYITKQNQLSKSVYCATLLAPFSMNKWQNRNQTVFLYCTSDTDRLISWWWIQHGKGQSKWKNLLCHYRLTVTVRDSQISHSMTTETSENKTGHPALCMLELL